MNKRGHFIGSNNSFHNIWVTSVRRSESVILVSGTFIHWRTTHTHSAPITHSCVIPQNRKTLACWRTDFMWLLWLLPLPADRTIEAAHKELCDMRVFLGSAFHVVVFQRWKYTTNWRASSLKATALGNTWVQKVIRPSKTGVWNKTYL